MSKVARNSQQSRKQLSYVELLGGRSSTTSIGFFMFFLVNLPTSRASNPTSCGYCAMKIAPQLFPVVLPCPAWKMAYQWCCPELLPPTTSAPGSGGVPKRSSDVVEVESPSTMVSVEKNIVEKPDIWLVVLSNLPL